MTAKILIGTASWSDPEFIRDWYPARVPARSRLAYYAGHFDMVELNSSFYAVPQRRLVEAWAHVTPPGFVFNVKLHKLLSRHSCEARLLPLDLQHQLTIDANERVELSADLEAAVARRFVEALEPFVQSGKLGLLLLQLSPSFSPEYHMLAELEPLLGHLAPHTVAVEFRNRFWVEGYVLKETTEFLRKHGAVMVSVDAPASENFNVMPPIDVITQPAAAYLRLHGRNERAYLRGKSVAERFDYDYSDAELQDVAQRVEHLAREAQSVHVVFNNNRSDYAPDAAARFRRLLGQRTGQPLVGFRDVATLTQETFGF